MPEVAFFFFFLTQVAFFFFFSDIKDGKQFIA